MATTQRQLVALIAAGLISPDEAVLAQRAITAQADKREPTPVNPDGKFLPDDAGRPVTPVPDEVIITPEDVDAALTLWDEFMPEYRGLLAAERE